MQVSDFGTAQLETILKNVDHCGFPQNTEVSLFYVKSISRNFREIDFTKKLVLEKVNRTMFSDYNLMCVAG